MLSMTGYGRGEYREGGIELSVEIKTVNNRYLDAAIKSPRIFAAYEEVMRGRIREKLTRGHADVYVTLSDKREKKKALVLDEGAALSYAAAAKRLSEILPEVPFDPEKFLARVDELQSRKSNVIIAASEGVRNMEGVYLCDLVSTAGQLDAFGHKAILSGTSRYLSELIHERLGCKSRAIEFSTLQRCASHLASRTDVTEAYAVGGAAAAAAFAGESGRMIALKRMSGTPYQCVTESVDVQQVANLEKKVPLEWITPDGMQVTASFEEYARPLILDELTPIYVNGTPRHVHL